MSRSIVRPIAPDEPFGGSWLGGAIVLVQLGGPAQHQALNDLQNNLLI